MLQETDHRLATAAVLAHGALNSLSLLRHAYRVMEQSCDPSTWSDDVRALIDSVPAQIDLTMEHLRLIVAGADTPAGDYMDHLTTVHAIELLPTEELERRIGVLFERRLARPLTPEENDEYQEISEEMRRRRP